MNEILIEGGRLRLRRAEESDLKYIVALENAPENLKYIVPFDENFHRETIQSGGAQKLDVIIEERDTGERVGTFFLDNLHRHKIEFTHVIIGKKRVGYGRESLQLLLKWSFEVRKFHRACLDCKTYNEPAIHLYESLGFVREGVMRDTILTGDVYEDLILFGMLENEYFERKNSSESKK